MTESRRGFLAKCFGGALVAAAGGAIKLAEAKDGKVEVGPYELESTEFVNGKAVLKDKLVDVPKWSPPHIVLDDFSPGSTDILINDQKIAFVDRVYAWWPNQGDKPWVGMRIIIPPERAGGWDRNEVPRVAYKPPNLNHDCFPCLKHPTKDELLHVNETFKKIWGEHALGKTCYRVLQGREEPCPFCTNDKILGEYRGRTYVWEFQNETTKAWFRCADKAIEWFSQGFENHDPALPYLSCFPIYDSIRPDPRIQDLLRKMNLLVEE